MFSIGQFSGSCRVDQYQCTDTECIDSIRKCNGVDDCVDGSDEQDCGKILDNT